ncbi:unnamed protein product [Polarella glacialis]|uniref:Uncharacterized protein n=1 Tax=Polarella glacialis TaxID=89957 RepID=A0A813K2D7_POLGL|nr:unnamed protein product [Polarella glacialis]
MPHQSTRRQTQSQLPCLDPGWDLPATKSWCLQCSDSFLQVVAMRDLAAAALVENSSDEECADDSSFRSDLGESVFRRSSIPRRYLIAGGLSLLGLVAFVNRQSFSLDAKLDDSVVGLAEVDAKKFVSLGQGTACRIKAGDHTLVPPKGKVIEKIGGRDACAKACFLEQDSSGFEYRISEDRCELWDEPIMGHEHVFLQHTVGGKPDFECVLLNPDCATLTSQHKIFGKAVVAEFLFVQTECALTAMVSASKLSQRCCSLSSL